MFARTLNLFVLVIVVGWTSSASGQGPSVNSIPAPPTIGTLGDQANQNQDQETDKQALAKQMDEFHKRLMALESGAQQIGDPGSLAEQVGANKTAIDSTAKQVNDIDGAIGSLVAPGHGDMTMKLSGRIHADAWTFPVVNPGINPLEGGDPQNRFGFRRLRLGANGTIKDNLGYKIEMEFADPSAIVYKDAYFTLSELRPRRTLIVGNHKRPYGLDHLNSSRYNVFMARPFVIEGMNQDARRLGISTNGYSKDLCNNWRAGIFEQENTADTFGYVGDSLQLELAGRFARTWWYDQASGGRGYGHVAISGSIGSLDGLAANNAARWNTRPEARTDMSWLDTGTIPGATEQWLVGLESVFNVGPVQLVTEYMYRDVDRLDQLGNRISLHGGYVYVSYFLTGEHMPWNRQTGVLDRIRPFENFFSVCDCDGYRQRGLGAWQVAARYSYADFNDQDIIGGVGSALTLGLNWYWNPYTSWQVNYAVGDINREPIGGGDYQVLAARFRIDF